MRTTTLSRRTARIGDLLIEEQVITQEQLAQALEAQKGSGTFLGEVIVSLGFCSSTVIGPYLEETTGFPFVDLADRTIDLQLAHCIPEEIMRRKLVMAFQEEEDCIHIAMADPLDLATVDDLRS
ncbi:MAG TPA: hypothetical protein VGS41_08285, partial [Chthonomonadales bacterium]|nr:hypothetical protein [Chthonomonadales bacterium]